MVVGSHRSRRNLSFDLCVCVRIEIQCYLRTVIQNKMLYYFENEFCRWAKAVCGVVVFHTDERETVPMSMSLHVSMCCRVHLFIFGKMVLLVELLLNFQFLFKWYCNW